MRSLEDVLAEGGEGAVQALAGYIRQHIDERWQEVLREHREELLRLYDDAGEGAAYGTYAQRLFRPVRAQLERAGFRSAPAFPGTLATSREWGPPEARERWMWSVVRPVDEAPLGTLVIRLAHDHTRFRLPYPPGVLALAETDAVAIGRAVARAAGQPEGSGE